STIEPGVEVLEVSEIEGKFATDAVEVGIRRQLDLGQAGEPGTDQQALAVTRDGRFELRRELRAFRPRADQAHVATENVPKLWQLIEVATAQESANRGYSRVSGRGPTRPAEALTFVMHGADLVDAEGLAATTEANLGIQCGPARVETHGQARQQRQWDSRN